MRVGCVVFVFLPLACLGEDPDTPVSPVVVIVEQDGSSQERDAGVDVDVDVDVADVDVADAHVDDAGMDASNDARVVCPWSGTPYGYQCENTTGSAIVCSTGTEQCCVDDRACKPKSASCTNGYVHECTKQSNCGSGEKCCLHVRGWKTPDSCPHVALFGGTRCSPFCASDEVGLCNTDVPCPGSMTCETLTTDLDFANDGFNIHHIRTGFCSK